MFQSPARDQALLLLRRHAEVESADKPLNVMDLLNRDNIPCFACLPPLVNLLSREEVDTETFDLGQFADEINRSHVLLSI